MTIPKRYSLRVGNFTYEFWDGLYLVFFGNDKSPSYEAHSIADAFNWAISQSH